MNVCLVLVGLALACHGGQAAPSPRVERPAPHRDAWVGEDKLRHLGLSFAVTTLTFGGARTLLDPPDARVAAGAAAGAAAVGKEWWDLRDYGLFSVRDLAWDAAGIALGIALIHNIR